MDEDTAQEYLTGEDLGPDESFGAAGGQGTGIAEGSDGGSAEKRALLARIAALESQLQDRSNSPCYFSSSEASDCCRCQQGAYVVWCSACSSRRSAVGSAPALGGGPTSSSWPSRTTSLGGWSSHHLPRQCSTWTGTRSRRGLAAGRPSSSTGSRSWPLSFSRINFCFSGWRPAIQTQCWGRSPARTTGPAVEEMSKDALRERHFKGPFRTFLEWPTMPD